MFIHLDSLAWIVAGGIAVLGYFLYSQSYSLSAASPQADPVSPSTKSPKAAFHASRLTNSTFLIKEYNDVYSEHPHIYAKVVPAANTILLIDTGCGGASADNEIVIRSLKQFVEVVPVDSNDGKPLNEHGRMDYVVALTHCHYDHILAVEQFNNWPILASGHSPSFLAKEAIPEHSLCKPMGIRTPTYTPVLVPDRHVITAPGSKTSLGVIILHTPGHTPDEIALFDGDESMLYVGDSLYEYEHIIFPGEGSIVTWFSSMDFLVAFVKERNALIASAPAAGPKEVLINSGHVTALRPALNVLLSAIAFMKDVVDGKEVVKDRNWRRGEAVVTYEQDGGRFSLKTPERLVLEARDDKETSKI